VAVGGALVFGVSACGGSKSKTAPPPDPVTMALKAPGVRTVIVHKQSTALTIVVPPCGSASLKQSSTATPPGSNQIVVPKSTLDQTVAVQPCMQGAGQKNAEKSSTVLLSPGGSGSPQTSGQQAGVPQNQLLLPKNSNLTKIIVPPCVVQTSSSSSSSSGSSGGQSGGNTTVLPATGTKSAVTAPPCQVQMSSSSSS
jgi:hypothetical protein